MNDELSYMLYAQMEQTQEFETFIQNNYPKIWNEYLKHKLDGKFQPIKFNQSDYNKNKNPLLYSQSDFKSTFDYLLYLKERERYQNLVQVPSEERILTILKNSCYNGWSDIYKIKTNKENDYDKIDFHSPKTNSGIEYKGRTKDWSDEGGFRINKVKYDALQEYENKYYICGADLTRFDIINNKLAKVIIFDINKIMSQIALKWEIKIGPTDNSYTKTKESISALIPPEFGEDISHLLLI